MKRRIFQGIAGAIGVVLILLSINFSVARAFSGSIDGATFADPAKGPYVFQGDLVQILVQADSGFTMNADFSRLYGNPEGTNFVIGTDNLNDTYSVAYPISFAEQVVAYPEIILYSGTTEVDRLDDPEQLTIIANLNLRANKPTTCQIGTDESTDLSTVTDFRDVQLTLHCPGTGKIVFKNSFDFTSQEVMEFLINLSTMLQVDAIGNIGLTPTAIEYMAQQGAYITAYNLPYDTLPDIKYVDNNGVEHNPFTDGTVKNLTYDAATKIASFEVSHFSTFQTIPKVEISEPANNTASDSKKVLVKGTVNDHDATVKIYVNNVEQEGVSIDTNGAFEKEVILTQASNVIKVTSNNSIGSGYDVERTVTKNTPTIIVNDPADNTTVATRLPLIKGSVSDPYATLRVYVNNVDQGDIAIAADGTFEKQVTLTNKSNIIRVTATDNIHPIQEKTITLINNALPATGIVGWQWMIAILAGLLFGGLTLLVVGLKKRKRNTT